MAITNEQVLVEWLEKMKKDGESFEVWMKMFNRHTDIVVCLMYAKNCYVDEIKKTGQLVIKNETDDIHLMVTEIQGEIELSQYDDGLPYLNIRVRV